MDADVIVVGGAVAGAGLANALGSRGVRVLLIEKTRREIHSTRGDLLHPPTLSILRPWRVLDRFHEDGALPITELAVSSAAGGLVARFPIPAVDNGPAGRTLAVPHDRIESILFECASRWPTVETLRGTVTALEHRGGRVAGVRVRAADAQGDTVLTARMVAGCDGARSLIRRSLGIGTDEEPYEHEQVIISGEGDTELPAALHWYIDDIGSLCIVSRPRGAFRILLTLRLGLRGDLLKRPDPALRDYLSMRFPSLGHLRVSRENAYVYRLARHIADTFALPGIVLVGDAAHATHPAGATGMSLAISGAALLAERVAPLLLSGARDTEIDTALLQFAADRRPAAAAAIAANHAQALRIWQSDLYRDPDAYAAAVDPNGSWGAGGAGWGQDPAALRINPSHVQTASLAVSLDSSTTGPAPDPA